VTTTTTNRWLDLAELCAQLNTTPDIVGAASRRHYRYAGADTIEVELDDGVMIRKRGRYQAARYRVIPT
jgi:hypothetical protein